MLGSVPMIRATMLSGIDELLAAHRLNTNVELILDLLGSKSKPPHDITLDTYLLLLERVSEQLRDPCFGLTFAKGFPVGAMKVFSYLGIHAPDLRTMVADVSRYVRLQLDGLDFRFSEAAGIGTLTWQFNPDVKSPTKIMLEFCMALCVDRLRKHSGSDFMPVSAQFAYADPRTTAGCQRSYQNLFGTDLMFDADISSITAPSSQFERPLKSADRRLYELLREYADREMSEREKNATFEQRVTAVLVDCLPMQEGNLDSVAKALKRGPRQLQDELRREGTNFEAVLIAVRKRLAKSYLGSTTRSMTDIAMMLGFSELSAFTRAVKSWYGLTPTEMRDALKAGKDFN